MWEFVAGLLVGSWLKKDNVTVVHKYPKSCNHDTNRNYDSDIRKYEEAKYDLYPIPTKISLPLGSDERVRYEVEQLVREKLKKEGYQGVPFWALVEEELKKRGRFRG